VCSERIYWPPAFDAMTSTWTKVSLERARHDPSSIEHSTRSWRVTPLVITTLDRLGRSTQNMLAFADELRSRGAGLRVLNLGGGDVDTATPCGSMLFTIMAALAQMEHEIKRERVTDSIIKRREAGKDLGGRPRRVTDSQIRSAVRLDKGGEPAAQVARDLGMSQATFYRRSRTLAD
jgi:DNA invertase Pin-like site-specific DNA recombinase